MADPAVSGAGDAPGRLPRPRTSFVGRESELAQARHLLGHNRLLTLTGPGGCGKTRLSIALAADVMGAFPGGVRFVPLAAISDASLVPVSIAQGMGLQDSRGGSLLEHLSGYLGDRKLLLVLDNFEHVLAAGGFVQELLAGSSQLRILVTSRSPLHLSGEQEFPVPALRVPEPGGARSVTAVAACESAQLFAARAGALVPGFAVDEQNAGAIAGIVERLDGLPLAIELAAARVKLLPPAAILARLEDSLGLLVSGGRDAPDRQRTLRATISWSYDLLSDAARRLLAAASVFRGGISLESIEAVCAETLHLGVPVLDALQELADHSLLRLAVPSAPVPRYAMLETVREFAGGRLSTMPDAAAIRAAHAAQFGRAGQGPCPSAVLACREWARPAGTGARQLPCRPGLVPPGGPVRRATAGQPADRVLVRARPLLRGPPAPGRVAGTGPGRRPRAGGRAKWCGVARHRPGRPRFGHPVARPEHRTGPCHA